MKKRNIRVLAAFLAMNLALPWSMSPVMAEETTEQITEQTTEQQDSEQVDMSMVGSMAFAKCQEYVNVRSGAGTDNEVVGKIRNHHAAMIMDREGDWYKIKSGNVIGYVNTEYFAVGEEAQQIADEVAYCVAKVYPEVLMVRSNPDDTSEVVEMAQHNEELEVVDWDGGEWMKVAMGNDIYGYVNAYYVDYNKYYAVAETLEEERERLGITKEEQEGASKNTESTSAETTATESAAPETEYIPETEYVETEYVPETEYVETEYVPETEYVETEYVPETDYVETEYAAETEYVETEYVPETEYVETEYVPETEYVETEYVPETEYVETEYVPETEYVETEYVPETEYTSSTGQEIANFAVQFVGNPYVYGGTSLTNGADCSGFVQSVFASFGIGLARTAADQSYGGSSVDIGSIQAGDLLFYSDGSGISHVALYIGGGQIVHASTPESGIIISSYNYNTPVCARRYW